MRHADRCGLRKRVLVVAEETTLRAKIACMLQRASYVVELAENEKRALKLASDGKVDAAIIAPGLHPANVAFVRELGDRVPGLLLLAERSDDVAGFARSIPGVPVHVLQPLSEKQFLDDVAQAMAASGTDELAPAPAALLIGDGRVDVAGRVFVRADGREVILTRTELSLLTAFARRLGQVLSRDQLSLAITGHGAEPYARSVDMHISRLRRKIEPEPETPRFILTASGGGYKFAVAPQTAGGRREPAAALDLEKQTAEPAGPDGIRLAGNEPVQEQGEPISLRQFGAERRQLTVLSCELVAPVPAGSVDVEEFARVVQSFQAVCAAAVASMDGSIAGSAGHEISAFFGLPRAHEDDAERAVHTSFDLLAKVGELAWCSGKPLQARIGIATGLVIVCEKEVLGEPPTAASRLRNLTPPNSILVAPSTRRLLGRAFVCDGPSSYELPGTPDKLAAYVVTGRRPVESRFGSMRASKLTQFVGREHELRQLVALRERVQARKGQVALVCGEAGIGKSRVCEVFLERINADSHFMIRYQCSPHHTHSPFRPIIDQIEYAAHFEQGDAPEIKLKKMEAALGEAGTRSLADMQSCAILLSIPTHEAAISGLTPQRRKDLVISALVRHVLGLARTRPVVVELADAHWADSSTLELFGRIIASIRAAPVFVLMSFRPEFFPPWLDEPNVTMLRLDRLGREQTDAMIFDVAGQRALPSEIQAQIVSKSDGIPLFVEELTKSVVESGALQDAGDELVLAGQVRALGIPTTLLGSLTARLDRLGPAKEIGQIGAAIGRQFSYRLLAAVAPISGATLHAALAQLAAVELIFVRGEPPDSIYVFKHALIRDAAYSTLVRDRQQQLHRRIAEALKELFPETAETQPELLAHHLIQAGLTESAIDYLRQAGRRAIERSANAEAIRHLTQALELLQSRPEGPARTRAALGLEVMLTQATIARYGYAAPETAEVLRRAKVHIDDLTNPALKLSILYGIWACHYVRGEVAEQTGAAAKFLAEAKRHQDSAAMCVAHRIVGTTYLTKGEFTAALPHLDEARALFDPQHHNQLQYQYGQDVGAAALCYLSWALWHLGRVDQASHVATCALKRAGELLYPHTLVFTICHAHALIDIFRRRPEVMRSFADAVISLSTEHGLSHWVAFGRILEGWATTTGGEADKGIELLRAGIAAWQKAGARLWLPLFLALEAEACSKAGRSDGALDAIEQAITIAQNSGERWYLAEIIRIKAGLLWGAGGATDRVETLLAKSLELARSQQARCWELRTACDLALLLRSSGRAKEARQLLQPIYAQFTEGFGSADLRHAKSILDSL
jgi:DNA-binding response OmpR family regulator/class 3 adenylate cyclase/predicted ATPase